MTVGAPAMRRGVPLALGAAAALAPFAGQLAFAIAAIGVVGMAHGASDLAIVAPGRRPIFLAAYGAVAVACLGWWMLDPAMALPFFLIASAIHFGLEDAPPDRPMDRIARGVGMILVPAALHPGGFADVLALAGGTSALDLSARTAAALAGGTAAVVLLAVAARRRDPTLALGTAALLLLPPLVGFSVGFLVLHALPQTAARRRAMGCPDTLAYVRAVLPVLGAAVLAFGLIAALVIRVEPTGVRALFCAIAALALPHLLVTPFFESIPTVGTARPSRPAVALTR